MNRPPEPVGPHSLDRQFSGCAGAARAAIADACNEPAGSRASAPAGSAAEPLAGRGHSKTWLIAGFTAKEEQDCHGNHKKARAADRHTPAALAPADPSLPHASRLVN